jgi:translation initiation factor 2 beta subunit (eIF-2beta)/eIF-5
MGKDFYGEYKKCVQCGYVEDLVTEEKRTLPMTAAETDKRAA